MRPITIPAALTLVALLAGCGPEIPLTPEDEELRDASEAACRAQLALRAGVNSAFVRPFTSAKTLTGWETFLSVDGDTWLCTTDRRGNVNGLEPWGE